MSSDLSYLARLIQLIDKEGNDESKKKLWSLISMKAMGELKSFTDKDASHFITAVHELNFEQHILVQANHFYEDFPLDEIKSQLVRDFVEMEHCKRRDDFEGFSLAAFQQVENITNYLFAITQIWEYSKQYQHDGMYVYFNKEKQKIKFGQSLGEQLIFPKKGDQSIDTFFKAPKEKVEFIPKFKQILYFGYFKEEVKTFEEWNQVFKIGYNLYLSRNSNHRGSNNTESQTKNREDLEKNKYRYYLLFLGFLADFVQRISITYKKADKILENTHI